MSSVSEWLKQIMDIDDALLSQIRLWVYMYIDAGENISFREYLEEQYALMLEVEADNERN